MGYVIVPRMVPLRWFSPHCLWPHVPRRRLPATTPPVLFRSVHEISTLPSRHLSGRETDAMERHGQLPEVGNFGQTEEFMDFVWCFFPTKCRSYNWCTCRLLRILRILAGVLFLSVFFLLLVFKAGFSQTRKSQCQTANPKKNTLTLRPLTEFIVGFCFHLLLQSIDGLVGAIRWRLISFCPEEKSCIHEFHIGIHERNFVQPQKKSQTNTWHGLKLSQCKKLTIKKYL